MRRLMAVVVVVFAAVGILTTAASGGGGTGITATPASTQTFNGSYSATFVRSASGIINETNRVNTGGGAQNGWSSLDVRLQFRPLTGPTGSGSPTPNPACEGPTVTAPFTYVNGQPSLGGSPTAGYFIGTNPYKVCVYFVHTYAADLSASPNPVVTGHDVVFTSHLLVDGTASATPPATIIIHAYDTDSTCSTETWYGPFSTIQNGTNYTTVPLNASAPPGTYYYKAEASFGSPALTRWSSCYALLVGHDYTLTLQADGQSGTSMQDVAHHTIYTGLAMDGAYPVSGATVTFSVWAGTGCSGSLVASGITDPTPTDSSGAYSFDGGADPPGVYSVTAYTANATSNCVNVIVGETASLFDVTASPSTTWSCGLGATGGAATSGTVFWYRSQVTGDVTAVIKGAAPSTTYDIWVEQSPGTCPPGTSTPSNPGVTTDSSGNATITFTPLPGVTAFWLSMWTPAGSLTGTQVLRADAVSI